MNNRLITVNQNKYLEPLSSICKCYDYVWRIYPDGCVVMVDKDMYKRGCTSLRWVGKSTCGHLEYKSVEQMLINWLPELEKNCGQNSMKREIEVIKSIHIQIVA